MMNTKTLKLAALLGGMYVLAGVIIFPSWYFQILQKGGINYLIYEAQSTFLILNIIALVIIALIVFTIASFEKNHNKLYKSLQVIVNGKVVISIIWIVVFTAVFRLSSVSIFSKNNDILTLAEKVQVLEQKDKLKLAISSPIESIYINERKIEDIYAQISPKLQLSERSVGKKLEESTEGEVEVGDIVSISGKLEANQEKKDKYKTRNFSLSEKLVSIINYLDINSSLVKVLPITLESKELKNIDEAVRTLESYTINLDTNKLENIKNQIKKKAFQSKVSETYKVNSWVLISGPVTISSTGNNNYISINFEYVSGENTGVNFICNIPQSKTIKPELDMLLDEPNWELSIFGKLIHKKNTESIQYSVNCLAVYR